MVMAEVKEQLQLLEEQISSGEGLHWKTIEQMLNEVSADDNRGVYGRVCYYAAFYMLRNGRMEATLEYLNKSVSYLIGTDEEKVLARCYNMFGVIAHSQNNITMAMEQYEKSLEYARKYHSKMESNVALGNLADAFLRIGDYEQAVLSYEACIKDFEIDNDSKVNDILNYRKLLASYGYCLLMVDKVEPAMSVADRLLSMSCDINCELASRLSTYTFLTFLYYKQKELRRMQLVLKIAMDSALELEQISSEYDVLLNLIHFLCKAKQFVYLSELLHDLESKAAVEHNDGLLLQLLFIHMRYLSDEMNTWEFRQKADLFFRVKAECEKSGSTQMVRIMDLRSRLQQIDEQQKELEHANARLLYQVDHDGLSGLCNKNYLNRYLEKAFTEAVQKQLSLSILFLDIDFFKQMNDYYGHQKGDECIVVLAESLKKCMPDEFLARYGGDEFVVVMYGRSEEYVKQLVNMLLQDIAEKKIEHAASKVSDIMTVTIGIMHEIPQKYNRVWDFLSAADVALYQQKREKRGCARFFRE